MTRPTRAALEHLAATLDRALSGHYIDKLWRPEARLLLLRVAALRPKRLLVDLERGHPRVVVTARWPETPAAPDRETLILRQHLEGARVAGVRPADQRRLEIDLTRRGQALLLTIQLAGRYLNLGLFDAEGGELLRLLPKVPARDGDSPPLRDGPDIHEALDDDAFLTALDADSWAERDARALETRRVGLRRDTKTLWSRHRRALSAAERDLARAEAAGLDRHRGELLKAALHRVPPGASSVSVADWSRPDGAATEVALDPGLDPVANMERYFKRYRKFDRAKATIEARVLTLMERVEAAAALLAALDAARGATADVLDALASRLHDQGHRPRTQSPPGKRPKDAPALPYRSFSARDGSAILVGKGARDNDRLTFQVGRGNDVWLHARDVAGSHVILRAKGRTAPGQEALHDAALLAAWHSKARGDALIDVMWTERKHVRKARGAAPGKVTAAATRTLTVRADPERLERLYLGLDSDGAGAKMRGA